MEASVKQRDRPTLGPSELFRLGGASLVGSGLLFLVKSVADLVAGPPPATGVEIVGWATSQRAALGTSCEVYFFAAMFLVPGVSALHRSLSPAHPAKAALGCGAIAVLIPLMLVVDVVQGRLVFPVHGIRISPWNAELVVALYVGGLHAIDLVFGLAAIVLALAMRRETFGSSIAGLGFAAGGAALVAAYPWLLSPLALVLVRALPAAWLAAVGVKLYRTSAA